MKKAIIGVYFKTEKLAMKEKERKEKIRGVGFEVIKFEKGYLMISGRQLKKTS